MGDFGADDRAVSETAGVAILIGITILVTGTVGLNVLVTTELSSAEEGANFTYDHIESNNALLITHVRGEEFPADSLVIEGEDAETTWAAAAKVNASEMIGPGDTVQISRRNSYGDPVRTDARIRIYGVKDGERRQLSEWAGPRAKGN